MLFMWLSASVLIILGLFCSSSNGLLSESQVEKLLKNLNNDEYKNSLPNILYHCTIGSKLYNEVDCLSAKYIFRISLQTDPISNPSITKERSLKVDNTGQEITYSLQLEDYILKSRPFKSKCKSCKNFPYENLVSEVSSTDFSWLHYFKPNNQTGRAPLPSLAYNSYYRKFNHRYTYYFQQVISPHCYFEPCIVEIPEGEAVSNAFQCPAGAHTLLWSPTFHQLDENGTIIVDENNSIPTDDKKTTKRKAAQPSNQFKVRLFDSKRHRKYFEPTTDIVQLPFSSLQHKQTYRKHGFEDLFPNNQSSTEDNTPPLYTPTTLTNDEEVLFIPSNYIYSMYHEPKDSSSRPDTAPTSLKTVGYAMLLCVHDASNIQELRQYFHLHREVSKPHAELFEYVNTVRTTANSGSGSAHMNTVLDFMNMEKYPSEFALSQFHTITMATPDTPPATATDATESNPPATDTLKQEAETSATGNQNTNRRNRRKTRQTETTTSATGKTASNAAAGGANDFRGWQDLINWKVLIEQLTLPYIPSHVVTTPTTLLQRHEFSIAYPDSFYFNTLKGMQTTGTTNGAMAKTVEAMNQKQGVHLMICPVHNEEEEEEDKTEGSNKRQVLLDDQYVLTKVPDSDIVTISALTSSNISHSFHVECIERMFYHNSKFVNESIVPDWIDIPIDVPSPVHEYSTQLEEQEGLLAQYHSRILQDMYAYTITVSSLRPSTFYQYRVAIVTHQTTVGPYTPWSPLVQTLSLAPPKMPLPPNNISSIPTKNALTSLPIDENLLPTRLIAVDPTIQTIIPGAHFALTGFPMIATDIYFQLPEDDGGSPILGYVVYMRYLKENYPTSWLYKGTYSLQPMDDFHPKKVQSIKIYNLYPMIQYEFKIAAFNDIGESPFSIKTNTISFHQPYDSSKVHEARCDSKSHFIVYGKGHEAYYGPTTSIHWHRKIKPSFFPDTHDDIDYNAQLTFPKRTTDTRKNSHEAGKKPYDQPFLTVQSEVFLRLNVHEEKLSVHAVDHHSLIRAQYAPVALWRSAWSASCGEIIAAPSWILYNSSLVHDLELLSMNLDESYTESVYVSDIEGKIVFAKRNKETPFYQYALFAQRLNALAVVIVDDSSEECVAYTEKCLPGANQYRGEGFAAMDVPQLWSTINIPVFFVLSSQFNILQSQLVDHTDYLHSHLKSNIRQEEL